jgi:hypothetical protein
MIQASALSPGLRRGGQPVEAGSNGAEFVQVNFRVPNGVPPGSAVPVRLIYIERPSNEVPIGLR